MARGTRTRDWATVDYYARLGITPDATDEDIARAFRAVAKQLHPDTNTDSEAVEQFKEASAAYAVLSNPRLRRDYDGVRDAIAAGRDQGDWSGWGTGRPPAARGEVRRFQAAPPSGRGFTRRRAWIATVGGVVVTLLGLAAGYWTLQLHERDAASAAAASP